MDSLRLAAAVAESALPMADLILITLIRRLLAYVGISYQ